jgi:hypothetical protein
MGDRITQVRRVRRRSSTLAVAAVAACSALFPVTRAVAAGLPVLGHGRTSIGRQSPSVVSPTWITSVSCASAGNCVAAGFGTDVSGNHVAIVVDETNGIWGTAMAVRGLASLSTGGNGLVTSVSCVSAGDCAAVGSYSGPHRTGTFLVNEKNGKWGIAAEVPGLARLSTRGSADADLVSCASAGNCSATGAYDMRSTLETGLNQEKVFAVTERNGIWGSAQQVPGLVKIKDAAINSVSCAAAGDCSAVGTLDARYGGPGFVVSENNGIWGSAQQVPGLAHAGDVGIGPVSCVSAGTCTAGGFYAGPSSERAFVIEERNGTWSTARRVLGSASLNAGGVASLSCASAGNCSAAGWYSGPGSGIFVVSEKNGVWDKAAPLGVSAAISRGRDAGIASLSCGSAGNCGAVGTYLRRSSPNTSFTIRSFAVTEKSGAWGTARELTGPSHLSKGHDVVIDPVSCGSPGNCGAGGYYVSPDGGTHAFVVNERDGSWRSARPVRPGARQPGR